MPIEGMTVTGFSHPAFIEAEIELHFDKRVNLFIGPNATGKSSLLHTLAMHPYVTGYYEPAKITVSYTLLPGNEEFEHVASENLGETAWSILFPWIYIPATRVALPSELDWNNRINSDDEVIDEDGNINWQQTSHIFDGRWIEQVYKDLHDYLKNNQDTNEDIIHFHQFLDIAHTAGQCAQSISKEVVTGRIHNHVEYPYQSVAERESYEPLLDVPYVRTAMGVYTKAGQNTKPVNQYAGDLSAGTQGVYLLALYVGLKIWAHYKRPHFPKHNEGNWKKQPAILLIDEIENHLHPTWQRRVIPALLDHFPKLQIFATTHSPFVVAGLKAGQVHLLNRDANGVVTATTNAEDIIGWTADQILRTMMGVDEPTDQATADRLSRLRQLREKETLTPEEESELNELRRRENADLLSKGDSPLLSENDPSLKAQRERYSDLMQGFLRSRQSDLSQDGA